MKITTHVVRTLLALLFLWAVINYFFKLMPNGAPPSASVQDYMKGIITVNLLNIAKVIELVCGILLVINVCAPLANVVLFPVSVNILIMQVALTPNNAAIPVVVILMHLFLAYAYRKNYAGLFSTKSW